MECLLFFAKSASKQTKFTRLFMASFFALKCRQSAAFLRGFLLSVLGPAGVFAADSAIDHTVALQIGPNKVSQYVVAKNFARFNQSRQGDGERSKDAASRWFELFLAKQVIIAEAIDQGFDKRAEVLRVVEAMERNILSKEYSPPDPALLSKYAVIEEQLQKMYQHSGIVPSVVGARLSSSKAKLLTEESWIKSSTSKKIERLKALAGPADDCLLHEGPLPWPREPFEEIASNLAAATADSWIERKTPDGTILVYVRSIQTRSLPPFESQREQFGKFVQMREQQRIQRNQRAARLRAAGAQVDGGICVKLAEAIKALPPKIMEVPSSATEGLSNEVLASYASDNQRITVTVEAWRNHFNDQFIRRFPRIPMAVKENVEAMIAVDLAVREAREQKRDQAPQFVEDRRNFLHHQALELFEKEQLTPKIRVSDDEVKAHYEKYQATYSHVSQAQGWALRFESPEKAAEWLQQSKPAFQEALSSAMILGKTEWDVSSTAPLAGSENMTEALLRLPEGQALGPVPAPEGCTVFIKRSEVKSPMPLQAVAERVRSTLMRERLDELELALAKELVKKYEVIDRIPYARFGVSESLRKPWSEK